MSEIIYLANQTGFALALHFLLIMNLAIAQQGIIELLRIKSRDFFYYSEQN